MTFFQPSDADESIAGDDLETPGDANPPTIESLANEAEKDAEKTGRRGAPRPPARSRDPQRRRRLTRRAPAQIHLRRVGRTDASHPFHVRGRRRGPCGGERRGDGRVGLDWGEQSDDVGAVGARIRARPAM